MCFCATISFTFMGRIGEGEFENHVGKGKYVDFGNLMYTYNMARYVNGISAILSWLKLFKYLQIEPKLGQLSRVLEYARWDLLTVTAIFLIVYIGFAQGFYTAFPTVAEFQTLMQTIAALFRAILGDFDFYGSLKTENSFLGPMMFGFFIVLVFLVLLNFFLAIINNSYFVILQEDNRRAQSSTYGFGYMIRQAIKKQQSLVAQPSSAEMMMTFSRTTLFNDKSNDSKPDVDRQKSPSLQMAHSAPTRSRSFDSSTGPSTPRGRSATAASVSSAESEPTTFKPFAGRLKKPAGTPPRNHSTAVGLNDTTTTTLQGEESSSNSDKNPGVQTGKTQTKVNTQVPSGPQKLDDIVGSDGGVTRAQYRELETRLMGLEKTMTEKLTQILAQVTNKPNEL